MKNNLVSFTNEYIETKEDLFEEGDVVAIVHIDGYPEDENEEGETVAMVYITEHGDYVINWHNRIYQDNETVRNLIAESKLILKEIYNNQEVK